MKKPLNKIVAIMLVLVMTAALASACNKSSDNNQSQQTSNQNTTVEPSTATGGEDVADMDEDLAYFLRDWGADPIFDRKKTQTSAADPNTPLVVGCGEFSEKFSPFFGETGYDVDVSDLCSFSLMVTDRMGGIVYNGIQGETVSYNGVDYFYNGPANLYVKYNPDTDITTYRARIRQDLVFSDGVPVTADDIIFSLYTYLDEDYNGPSTLFSYDIVGLRSYRSQTPEQAFEKYEPMLQAFYNAGDGIGYDTRDDWDQELYDAFWIGLKQVWIDSCQKIVDVCVDAYADAYAEELGFTADQIRASEGLQTAFGMLMWGFGDIKDNGNFIGSITGREWTLIGDHCPSIEDYYTETYEAYKGSYVDFWDMEDPDEMGGAHVLGEFMNTFIHEMAASDIELGASSSVKSIVGIKKLNDYAIEIQTHGFEASAAYNLLGFTVAPLHYYGDPAQYDYENGQFGFPRGDLSIQREKTTKPLGAGPYKFLKYENKTVYLEANERYFKGEPLTKNLQLKEAMEDEITSGIVTGTIDSGEISGSTDSFNEIKRYNTNGELNGEAVTTISVLNLGYGYICLYAPTISVDSEPGSDASKNLRKALATILAVYRDTACHTYFSDVATVIQYPISNTSWAAPQPTDQGYETAFSKDVNGNPIYTAAMTPEEKYAAAKAAALGFFEAAGFTVENGKVTAGPAEARRTPGGDLSYLEYEAIIPAGGKGDHPAYSLLTDAKAALAEMGITLIINDPTNNNILWNAKNAGTAEIFTAAWLATIDPDMYQIYHSDQTIGTSGYNDYGIKSDKLDSLIIDARKSADQTYRKAVYKQALDEILDWAVEVPNYQRLNAQLFSTERVNTDSLAKDITTFYIWLKEVENVEMR